MNHTGILIQSRMSSSRLPGKVLLKIGDYPLLYYVIKRMQILNLPIVVCTSSEKTDDPIVSYLQSQKINFFRGELNNVLKRFIDAASEFHFDNLFRITADNPFVDIDFISKNYEKITSYDYVDGIHGEGFLYGTGFEFVRLNELKNICSMEEFYLENVTTFLRENMKETYLRLIPEGNKKINDRIFLSCDYPEDFTLISLIHTCFNFRHDITTDEILALFEKYKGLYKINSDKHQIPNL